MKKQIISISVFILLVIASAFLTIAIEETTDDLIMGEEGGEIPKLTEEDKLLLPEEKIAEESEALPKLTEEDKLLLPEETTAEPESIAALLTEANMIIKSISSTIDVRTAEIDKQIAAAKAKEELEKALASKDAAKIKEQAEKIKQTNPELAKKIDEAAKKVEEKKVITGETAVAKTGPVKPAVNYDQYVKKDKNLLLNLYALRDKQKEINTAYAKAGYKWDSATMDSINKEKESLMLKAGIPAGPIAINSIEKIVTATENLFQTNELIEIRNTYQKQQQPQQQKTPTEEKKDTPFTFPPWLKNTGIGTGIAIAIALLAFGAKKGVKKIKSKSKAAALGLEATEEEEKEEKELNKIRQIEAKKESLIKGMDDALSIDQNKLKDDAKELIRHFDSALKAKGVDSLQTALIKLGERKTKKEKKDYIKSFDISDPENIILSLDRRLKGKKIDEENILTSIEGLKLIKRHSVVGDAAKSILDSNKDIEDILKKITKLDKDEEDTLKKLGLELKGPKAEAIGKAEITEEKIAEKLKTNNAGELHDVLSLMKKIKETDQIETKFKGILKKEDYILSDKKEGIIPVTKAKMSVTDKIKVLRPKLEQLKQTWSEEEKPALKELAESEAYKLHLNKQIEDDINKADYKRLKELEKRKPGLTAAAKASKEAKQVAEEAEKILKKI